MIPPRTALVTGAGGGIGRALALALAREGYRVMVTDLREDAARETLSLIPEHVRGEAAALDVTDAAAFARTAEWAASRTGTIDLLVNNAGIGAAGEVRDLSVPDWLPVLDVNLRGTIHGIQSCYPMMVDARRGAILNVASGAGLCPRPGMVPYAAAKHAVVGLSTSLRAEAAPLGIHVCVACPGYIATDILSTTRYTGVDGQKLQASIPIKPMSAEECARRIIRGLNRNRAIIPVGGGVSMEWLLYRLFPGLVLRLARIRAAKFSEARNADPDP